MHWCERRSIPILAHAQVIDGALLLIGPQGAGKSTLAAYVATKTGRIWLDTDALVLARCSRQGLYARTIPELVEMIGMAAFRQAERVVIQDLPFADSRYVVSLGGGSHVHVFDVLSSYAKCMFFLVRWRLPLGFLFLHRLLVGLALACR